MVIVLWGISSLPIALHLQKAVILGHSNDLCTLKKPVGTYTGTSEDASWLHKHSQQSLRKEKDKRLAGNIANKKRLLQFRACKFPHSDGIYTCLLQHSANCISGTIVRKLGSSILPAHVPSPWKEVKVVCIPIAAGTSNKIQNALRTISLRSFLIKT